MKIVAHRGARFTVTENTKASLLHAIKHKADFIECDIHATKDNQLVLHHDNSLMRIYSIDAKISKLTLAQAKAKTRFCDDPIITLDEAIKITGKTPLIIELKTKKCTDLLIDYINQNGIKNIHSIISFKLSVIKKIKNANIEVKTGFIASKWNFMISPFIARSAGAEILAFNKMSLLFPIHIAIGHFMGLELGVYPINNYSLAFIVKILGIQYLETDYPEIFQPN